MLKRISIYIALMGILFVVGCATTKGFEKILSEQGLTLTGVLENQQSIIGKLKGVDAIIVGTASVSRGFAGLIYGGTIDYVSNCTARMIDVATGEIIVAATFTASTASTQRGVTTATEVGQLLAEKIIASETSY